MKLPNADDAIHMVELEPREKTIIVAEYTELDQRQCGILLYTACCWARKLNNNKSKRSRSSNELRTYFIIRSKPKANIVCRTKSIMRKSAYFWVLLYLDACFVDQRYTMSEGRHIGIHIQLANGPRSKY